MKVREDLYSYLVRSVEHVNTSAEGTIGAMMELKVLDCDPEQGVVRMTGKTQQWMQNYKGALHGGISATMVDQAMGCVAYALKPGKGNTMTISMQLNYHRPLIPGEEDLIVVRAVSATRSIISLQAEVYRMEEPEKLCLSSSATFFFKPAQ